MTNLKSAPEAVVWFAWQSIVFAWLTVVGITILGAVVQFCG
ncbi:hypothetical protein LCGC14_1555080 [marine sediment metagenome]|uniref:Uncharacterized protein n=1 Tax=marine sediment metagenome TaxID=412755 RepID=A0A0F9LPY8_9ZZZZ